MSLRVIGYTATGQRVVIDEGPNLAHLTGGNTRGTAAGSFPVAYIASGVERPASHHAPAPKRAARQSLRGQAMLDRGRHDR